MQETHTQVAVIGAGPGGYAAAFLAADLGLQVALIDPERNPGGVCLHRGCIPSKALLHVAKTIRLAKEAAEWGVQFAPPAVDIDKIRAWKDAVVEKLTAGLGMLTRQRKIRYLQGVATLKSAHSLQVKTVGGGSEELTFDHAILATGSRSAIVPSLRLDSPRVWDSTAALELRWLPKTLLVIGGGYIGLELGSVYAALGSRVSVVEMMPELLPGTDKDLVAAFRKSAEKFFEAVMLQTTVARLRETDAGIEVAFEGSNLPQAEATYEAVLVAVGRKPNSEGLGLENTRVEVDKAGFVVVDEQRRTAEPSLFAIGDLVGGPMLAHKASHEGRVAAEVIAGGDAQFEPRAIPAVVYIDPEIAYCGLTEAQAAAAQRAVQVAKFPWAASGRALTMGRSDGLTKLLIDPATEKVLGVGLVGPEAGELIAEGVVAMEMGASAADLAKSIHPHPTLSETIMEAAEVFCGLSTHIYRPRRR
ncbi:MAG: dihydrolipoyl dehydrogenase [bacterium]|jgi:dihydrolipoamide dehydrogenase|nr:dihydrolipoyl dehydrogenase [candidate division KSB1 bacterium]MDH7559775.1 dihydrolipoyl dehydrogenase [bacterium]